MKTFALAVTLMMIGCGQPGDPSDETNLELTGASCKAASDCKGPLPQLCKTCSNGETGGCAHYDCVSNKCAIAYCEPAAPAPGTCKKASDCHGILPQLCKICGNGTEECEHFVCVSGQCQEQLCPQCTKASDCKGPLPQLCEICSNGKEECAHHACESGVCTTQICE